MSSSNVWQSFTNNIEVRLNDSDWTSLSSDVLLPFTCEYGIREGDRLVRLGRVGKLSLTLDNSHTNGAKVAGKYTPKNANALTGWKIGTPVRWHTEISGITDFLTFPLTFPFTFVSKPATKYKFYGKVSEINPTPDEYGEQIVEVVVEDWLREAYETPITILEGQSNKRIDEVASDYVDMVLEQPVREFSKGVSVFSFLGTGAGGETRVLSELQRLANSEPSYIFMKAGNSSDGRMSLVVENQDSRDTDNISAVYTVNQEMIDLRATEDRDDVLNSYKVQIHPILSSTDLITILNINYEIGIKTNRSATIGGYWADTDGNNVSAYGVGSDASYLFYSVYEYPAYRYPNFQAHSTNIIFDRILKYSTDITVWMTMAEPSTDVMPDFLDTNITGTHVGNATKITTDGGYAGIPYRAWNSSTDYSDISTNQNIVNFNQGTMFVCLRSPITTGSGFQTLFYGAGGTDYPSTDMRVQLFKTHWSGSDDVRYSIQLDNVINSDYATAQTTSNWTHNSDIENGWLTLAWAWDLKNGTTDLGISNIYINGELQGTTNTSLGVKCDTDSYLSKLQVGQNDSNSPLHLNHLVFFKRMLSASDIAYISTPSSDAGSIETHWGGKGWQIKAKSPKNYVGRLTNVNVTGYEMEALEPVNILFDDTDSQTEYGVSSYALDMVYKQSSSDLDYGFDIIDALATPRPNIDRMVFTANLSSNLADAFVNVEGGHEVNLVEAFSGISSDSWIVQGVKYTVDSPDVIYVEWYVYPR